MKWQLATWLDKRETPDGEHEITAVRDVDEVEVDRILEAIRVVNAYVLREPFVLVIENHMEYQAFEEHVRQRVRDDPLPLLQTDAQKMGAELRRLFLNWLLSFKAFLDLTEADLTRRFGKESPEVATLQRATNIEFDAVFGYRLMARLRNFGQHAAFPPLEGRIDVDVDRDPPRVVQLYLDRDKLLEWGGWTIVRPELEALPPEIPVTAHMNDAMRSLTEIAAAVKELDLPTLLEAAHLLNDLWEETSESPGVPLIGVFEEEGEIGMEWFWVPKMQIGTPDE